MEERRLSKEHEKTAKDLVNGEKCLERIRKGHVRIAYLSSDRAKVSKGRSIYAECEKVPDKYRWAVPYDFTVTVFEPNCERLDEGQMRILILHELMHVGIEMDGNEEKYSVVPHDIEDFREIVDRYGLDWDK